MRSGVLTRGIAVIGALWVLGSTFLAWSTGIENVPRRIYTYQPGPLPHHDLWQAAPVIAVLAVLLALLALALVSAPFRSLGTSALSAIAAVLVLAGAITCWLAPPGNISSPGSSIGEPLAIIGALELLAAATLSSIFGS